jgi:type VI secretion system VasD/TssJ family lipoprotein
MMRRRSSFTVLAAALAVIAGCSLIWPKPRPLFPADLCLHSDPQAQMYRGKANSLYVRAYPLKLPDAFNSTDVGVLLADPAPPLAGAAGTPQSRMLKPGSTEKLTFDAKEGETFGFIGVVAGYYDLKGTAKTIVKVEELGAATCYTVELGPSGITGSGPAPSTAKEK